MSNNVERETDNETSMSEKRFRATRSMSAILAGDSGDKNRKMMPKENFAEWLLSFPAKNLTPTQNQSKKSHCFIESAFNSQKTAAINNQPIQTPRTNLKTTHYKLEDSGNTSSTIDSSQNTKQFIETHNTCSCTRLKDGVKTTSYATSVSPQNIQTNFDHSTHNSEKETVCRCSYTKSPLLKNHVFGNTAGHSKYTSSTISRRKSECMSSTKNANTRLSWQAFDTNYRVKNPVQIKTTEKPKNNATVVITTHETKLPSIPSECSNSLKNECWSNYNKRMSNTKTTLKRDHDKKFNFGLPLEFLNRLDSTQNSDFSSVRQSTTHISTYSVNHSDRRHSGISPDLFVNTARYYHVGMAPNYRLKSTIGALHNQTVSDKGTSVDSNGFKNNSHCIRTTSSFEEKSLHDEQRYLSVSRNQKTSNPENTKDVSNRGSYSNVTSTAPKKIFTEKSEKIPAILFNDANLVLRTPEFKGKGNDECLTKLKIHGDIYHSIQEDGAKTVRSIPEKLQRFLSPTSSSMTRMTNKGLQRKSSMITSSLKDSPSVYYVYPFVSRDTVQSGSYSVAPETLNNHIVYSSRNDIRQPITARPSHRMKTATDYIVVERAQSTTTPLLKYIAARPSVQHT